MVSEEREEEAFLDEDVFRKVPETETYEWTHFLMIFIGMWASLAAVGRGVTLGLNITPWKGILGLFFGYMICMVYGFLVGRLGVKRRLATYPILQRPFSKFWAILPSLFTFGLAATFIGVQADVIARISMAVVNVPIITLVGPITNRTIISGLLCAGMMFTAYKGIRYIRNLSWASIPFYMSVLVVGIVLATLKFDGSFLELLTVEKHKTSFATATFIGVSLYAGFSAMLPDVSRFVKTMRGFTKAIIIGFISAVFIPASGVLMGAGYGAQYFGVFGAFAFALGIYAAVSMFLAQWTTNDNNAFTSGLALSTASRILDRKFETGRLNRKAATLIPILVGIGLSAAGAGGIGPLIAFVTALGSWLPPMAGVVIGHYYIVEKVASEKGVAGKGIAGPISWIAVSLLVHLGILPWGAITGVVGGVAVYVALYFGVESPLFGKEKI